MLKLIQVGLGRHGRVVGSDFIVPSRDFQYAGLVDLNVDALEWFTDRHGLSRQLHDTDYKRAFQTREADAVFITAMSPVHYEIAKEALKQNLHVLVEKPFVLSMEHAEELVQLAAEKQRILMVSQNYRFIPHIVTLKQTLKRCSFGKVRFVNAEIFYNYEGKSYQFQMDNYILMEISVHHVDMLRFLLDCNITSVWGRTWNEPNSAFRGDPSVHAVFQTESGVPLFYTGSLLAKGLPTPWEGNWRIQLEQGAVYLDDLGEGYGVYISDGPDNLVKVPMFIPEKESIHGVLAEFAESIRKGKEPSTSGRNNLNTLRALLAASESSATGREIKL